MSEKKDGDNECFNGEQGINCGCGGCEQVKKDNEEWDLILKLKELEKKRRYEKSLTDDGFVQYEYPESMHVCSDFTQVQLLETNNKYVNKGIEIGKLVAEKQKAYGDSFSNSGDILRKLFPNGITPDKYDDLLSITRIIDKLFRIANQKDAFGENPYDDLIGYALLGATKEKKK